MDGRPPMQSAKRRLLGNQAGLVPPAWRDSKSREDHGSKILLSRLPPDVGEVEVEESAPLISVALTQRVSTGTLPQDRRPPQGRLSHLQLAGPLKGHGHRRLPAPHRRRRRPRKVRRQVRRRS